MAAFSAGTFLKHLTAARPTPVLSARIHTECGVALTKPLGASLSEFETLDFRQKERIHLYVDTLLRWNQKMNLTAVRDVGQVMERHIEDSLAMVPAICSSYSSRFDTSNGNVQLVDVGSGAGLPGIVLAIARPDWQVTLMESMKKRSTFLEHAVRLLGMMNVKVVRGRAEDLGQNSQFRECFDVAVARAVAEMRVLAEYCLPLVRVGGLFVAAKGHDPQDEVKNAETAIRLLGGSILNVSAGKQPVCYDFCGYSNLIERFYGGCPVESSSPYGQRTVVICLKERPTPGRYPRDPGTPAKEPL